MKRGEVWLVALDPTVGREIRKARLAVVVSPDQLNDHLETVVVAPMTTGSGPKPYHVALTFDGKPGFLLLEQIRAVEHRRLVRRLGRVPGKTLADGLQVLQRMFAE